MPSLYAKRIKANQSVAEAAKINLGLRVDDGVRTPVPAPLGHWSFLAREFKQDGALRERVEQENS